jgi:capsular polysaccharide biosynthesis protein/Mrp family chromosome partitioning ATPase
LLGQQQRVDAILGTSTTSADPERDLNTSVALITLEPVAQEVRRRLRLAESSEQLLGRVATAPDSNTNLVSITARASSPTTAAAIANAFADGYRDFRTRAARASVDAALAAAARRLARLDPAQRLSPFGRRLASEVRRLSIVSVMQTGGVQVVGRAQAPAARSGHGILFTGVVAFFIGLILAALAVVVVARTDRRIHEQEDVKRLIGVNVLVSVPDPRPTAARRRVGESDGAGDIDQAFAILAARVAVPRSGTPARAVLLSAPEPHQGTPEVAVRLAQTLAAMGHTALVIEADLREPVFAHKLGIRPRGDLGRVLLGEEPVKSQLVELPDRLSGSPKQRVAAARKGRAWALPARRVSSDPGPLLGNAAIGDVFGRARQCADFVLIAGAPLNRPADTLVLSRHVDAALLVVCRKAQADPARRAVQCVGDFEVPLLGAILVPPQGGPAVAVGPTERPAARRARAAPGQAPVMTPPRPAAGYARKRAAGR